jgi:hypothetical protein
MSDIRKAGYLLFRHRRTPAGWTDGLGGLRGDVQRQQLVGFGRVVVQQQIANFGPAVRVQATLL